MKLAHTIKATTLNNMNEIESHKIEIKCLDGRIIKGYIDKKRYIKDAKHLIIISHGYGETKRDYISTSYYLASNDFIVLRYDCLNHLGESDGDVINFVLTDMEFSLRNVINYVEHQFKLEDIGVISSSLSSRTAFRVATENNKIKYIIALTSVVDLSSTLMMLYKEDLISEYKNGMRWGVLDILGFELRDDFLKDVIENNYTDLSSTLCDVREADAPICYLAAGDDAWIKYGDVKLACENTKNKESVLISIPGALHQIQENPKLAKEAILRIVESCSRYSKKNISSVEELAQPSIHNIVRQNKIEMLNLKSIFSVTKTDEKNFWAGYLSKFFIIMKSNDYQNLLSLIAQLLGEVSERCDLLDAGCGNGHFGAWLLCNLDTIIKKDVSEGSFNYVGIDFAENAIKDAKHLHEDIWEKVSPTKNILKKIKSKFEYILADLEYDIPFGANTFDKICCNLVISYLKDYKNMLKNLYSCLKPGGRIVISSLKPYSDLSLVYKNYIDQNITVEDILEGRNLLSSAGKIRHKEKQGHYHFFSEQELKIVMEKAGFVSIKTYRAFGNQANVAVGEKQGEDNGKTGKKQS